MRISAIPLIAICCCAFFQGTAQTRTIDSLKQNIRKAGTKEQQVNAIFALCDLGYTLHPDTLMLYADRAKKLSVELQDRHKEITSMYYETGALTTKGLVDSSLSLADKCLQMLAAAGKDAVLEANLYNQKGRCYVRKNQYKEAIDMGLQTIAGGEKAPDVLLQVKGKTLIGWAYLEMGQLNDALAWHLKALRTTSDTLLLEKYAILFANLATNYNNLGKPDSAFYYIEKGIRYSRKHENLFALSNSLAIESELYVRSGQAKKSQPVLEEVVEIRKIIGDPFYIASDMAQLGYYYAHYGQPEKGIAVCNEGIAIAKKYNLDTKLLFLYSSLADNYKALSNSAKFAEVLEQIITLKNTVYEKNSAESIAELQARYDLQKKETLIIRQKLDLQQKNYLFYGSLFILVFAAFIAWVLFREYKRRQAVKLAKMQEDEKIRSVIAVTKAEEVERKRIAADLHDNIGAYASAIMADVENIADHGLANNRNSLENLQKHSQEIIISLRDTIWVLNKDRITITGISDRIKDYVNKLQPSYSGIKFHIHEEITNDEHVNSPVALNIFRIVQEAIHNALKHSRAKNIVISINSTNAPQITVSDDGIGIEDPENHTKGNGLLNMKARAQEADMRLSISTKKGAGTVVLISTTPN